MSVRYSVKELFYSLQGEGIRTGRPAVFCRFSGCNLWSGREDDRARAECRFCDTDFVGGEKFAGAKALADAVAALWPGDGGGRYVVCTGGEPALQLDRAAVTAFQARGFEVAIETNGTLPLPCALDWVSVSPKAGTALKVEKGDELKLVYPQGGADPGLYEGLDFTYFLLQPMDGPDLRENTDKALAYCLAHPRWSLSLQTHKALGIR